MDFSKSQCINVDSLTVTHILMQEDNDKEYQVGGLWELSVTTYASFCKSKSFGFKNVLIGIPIQN